MQSCSVHSRASTVTGKSINRARADVINDFFIVIIKNLTKNKSKMKRDKDGLSKLANINNKKGKC